MSNQPPLPSPDTSPPDSGAPRPSGWQTAGNVAHGVGWVIMKLYGIGLVVLAIVFMVGVGKGAIWAGLACLRGQLAARSRARHHSPHTPRQGVCLGVRSAASRSRALIAPRRMTMASVMASRARYLVVYGTGSSIQFGPPAADRSCGIDWRWSASRVGMPAARIAWALFSAQRALHPVAYVRAIA